MSSITLDMRTSRNKNSREAYPIVKENTTMVCLIKRGISPEMRLKIAVFKNARTRYENSTNTLTNL